MSIDVPLVVDDGRFGVIDVRLLIITGTINVPPAQPIGELRSAGH